MSKNITITMVAEKSGVSKTTVSRFLNGHYSNMSKATKERIAQTIAELNYRPNRQAQALKSKRSHLIGVVVADISNMYSTLLLKGIGEVLKEAGYQMIIMDAANSIEQEKDLLEKLIDQGVEGVILQPSSRYTEQYQFLDNQQIPLLLVDRQTDSMNWPLVTTNNVEATRKIIQEILKKGYKRVVVVSEPLRDVITREVRYQTVKEMVSIAGKQVDLIETNMETDLCEKVLKIVKEPKKTALFASNGRVLIELLKILISEQVKIPDSIGITGYDDWNMTALIGPGITSIEQQSQLIGETAANKMIESLQKGKLVVEEYIIPTKLQWRNSL
ncbi:LacI family DNA-binding transcriptional regulator [Enterococcus faecium]|uniref:LacI family DNA-binding transcriptional regulator n=1 Tax=Enterococcus TaxID=1350 RepID=UPI001898F2F2|nr:MULTISPECIES: LacI family DNA-binding transcriptional regulator [Enterococcus]EME7170178.1 LacI family DNA-binding transcriptional regulator [Enterococcus faecium]MDB7686526.1 LacI family DNA-binding transcriptional regulator [Enterococcus faecium]MDV5138397.1 LacI family DNA-binding transcriptional regulator [Enterococcus lactis]